MPLVTANQFRLHPDAAGAIDQGVSSGQKLRSQFQLGKRQEKAAATEEEKNRYISVVQGASKLSTLPNDEAKVSALDKRIADLTAKGLPTQDTDELRNLFISGRGEEANALIESTVKDGVLRGVLKDPAAKTTAQRDFEFGTKGLTPEQVKQARLVDLGLVARAGSSAQERLGDDPEKSARVAESQAKIEAAKETAKLSSQLKLKPEVEAAVVAAVGDAKLQIKAAGEERSNKVAFNVYETAISNLVTSLGGTTTGPGAGFIPAITANAQIADGAVAMMAPVLKQLFRGAGEGTFTDQDQKMLLALIPDRNTLPAARKSQLAAIDALVRAKLRITETPDAAPTTEPAPVTAPAQGQEFDSGLLEFMTDEERALFDGA